MAFRWCLSVRKQKRKQAKAGSMWVSLRIQVGKSCLFGLGPLCFIYFVSVGVADVEPGIGLQADHVPVAMFMFRYHMLLPFVSTTSR